MSKITDPKEKMSAALGAFVFFIPHFMEKKTEFVTFYMRQSFGIFLLCLAWGIVRAIIVSIVGISLVSVISTIFLVFNLGLTVIAVYLIFMAYKGEKVEIPYLYKYTNILIEKVQFLQPLFAPKK